MPEIRREQIPPSVLEVCARLSAAGHRAYVVGGCVRDLLLGRQGHDFDIATSARPTQVMRLFRRTVPTGLRHGTVTVLSARGDDQPTLAVEVTTFRGEGAYSDGRHPDRVEFVTSIEEDLGRRDFTVNALAFDPLAETLVDPHGGRADLEARKLRAVGEASVRFAEDGLRTLRAVRFAATLGLTIEPATLAAIPCSLDVLRKVSQERIRDELLKMLLAPRPSLAIELMRETSLLTVVLPELLDTVGVTQNRYHAFDVYQHALASLDAAPAEPSLRLAALLHDLGKPATAATRADDPEAQSFYRHEQVGAEMVDGVLRRLRLSTRERARIVHLVAHHMFWFQAEWSPSAVRRFLRRVGKQAVPDLLALREADVRGRGLGEDPEAEVAPLRARIEEVLREDSALRVSDLAIGGAEVMRTLGIGPGPQVGEVLRRLLERVLDDPAENTAERLLSAIPEVASLPGTAPR